MKVCDLNAEMLAAMITEDMINEAYEEALNELSMQDVKDGISKAGDNIKLKIITSRGFLNRCLIDPNQCITDAKNSAVGMSQKMKSFVAAQVSLTKQMIAVLEKYSPDKFKEMTKTDIKLVKGQLTNIAKIIFILGAFAIPLPGASVALLKAAEAAFAPASIYPSDLTADTIASVM